MNNQISPLPLVSCILPFYNAQQYLGTTLKSLEQIGYSNLELILVNDGSTDQSLPIVHDFLEKSHSLKNSKVVNNAKNFGISYSKNIGMEKSSGDYFFFAAADDIQNPTRVIKPLEFLVHNPTFDIVYFDCNICSEDGSFLERRGFPEKMNLKNSILFQLKRNHFWSGLFLARNLFNQRFDESLSSAVDYDWYFNLYFSKKKIAFLNESFLDYRTHQSNISKNLSSSLQNVRAILSKYDFTKLKENLLHDFSKNEVFLSFAWFEVTLGNYKNAIELLQSIELDSNFFEITFLLGSSFFQLKEYGKAINYFSNIISLFPQSVESMNNLAVSQIYSGEYNMVQCHNLFKNSLRINPRYSDARLNSIRLSKGDITSLTITEKPLRSTLIHG
ncbi:MAG: glycosyltransferase [Opitutae bacterium]